MTSPSCRSISRGSAASNRARLDRQQRDAADRLFAYRPTVLLPTLDRGEAEVIILGLERQATLVLLDELIGRRVAESLELPLSGSVGILIRAKQIGAIPAVRPLLEEMIRQGLYFSRRFVDSVLRQVQE